MNSEAFDAPAAIEPADIPLTIQQFAYAPPPILTAGSGGTNNVIAIEIVAYQKS